MSEHPQTIGEAVDALTNPWQHTERIPSWTSSRHRVFRAAWTTSQPSLLDQLAEAIIPGEGWTADDSFSHGAFGPIPPARLDAIDRLLAIEAGTAAWCVRVGLELRRHTTMNLRALVGAHVDSTTATRLIGDLHAWHTWAATVTGWQDPPFRPNAPCPACESRGGLRVRAEQRVACCVECGAAWDSTTIGVLAEWVKLQAEKSRAAATERRLAERAKLGRPA